MSSTLCSNTQGPDHNARARRQRCDACTHTIPVRPPDPIQTLAGRQQTHHQAGNTVTLPPVLRLGSRPDLACLAPGPDERRDTSDTQFTAQHVDHVIARAQGGGYGCLVTAFSTKGWVEEQEGEQSNTTQEQGTACEGCNKETGPYANITGDDEGSPFGP